MPQAAAVRHQPLRLSRCVGGFERSRGGGCVVGFADRSAGLGRMLHPGSSSARSFARSAMFNAFDGISEHRRDLPGLALPAAVAELREVVPRKTLRDLRQARRRAAAAGAVAALRAEASTFSGFMQDFFRLHEGRWQPIAGHGVCADPVVRNFHLTAAQRMLDAGMLRLYLLRVGNSTAAAYYGFTAKRTAYAYLSGFDPEFAELSPGTQIVAHAIEEAYSGGRARIPFPAGGRTLQICVGRRRTPEHCPHPEA